MRGESPERLRLSNGERRIDEGVGGLPNFYGFKGGVVIGLVNKVHPVRETLRLVEVPSEVSDLC